MEGNANKRTVHRLDYAKYNIDAVAFETAGGMTDLDCSISFTVGRTAIKIDISKDVQPMAIRLYQCLTALCRQQQKNLRYLEFTKQLPAVHIHLPAGSDPATSTTAALSGWVNYAIQSYDPENYGVIFQQYFP